MSYKAVSKLDFSFSRFLLDRLSSVMVYVILVLCFLSSSLAFHRSTFSFLSSSITFSNTTIEYGLFSLKLFNSCARSANLVVTLSANFSSLDFNRPISEAPLLLLSMLPEGSHINLPKSYHQRK